MKNQKDFAIAVLALNGYLAAQAFELIKSSTGGALSAYGFTMFAEVVALSLSGAALTVADVKERNALFQFLMFLALLPPTATLVFVSVYSAAYGESFTTLVAMWPNPAELGAPH